MTRRIPWRRVALAVYLALLALGVWLPTPPPASDVPRLAAESFEGFLADAIRNVVLFLPFGALLAVRGRPVLAIAGWALLVSGLAELGQTTVPGRFPSVADLATNALGAALGGLLYRHRQRWLAPTPSGERALAASTLVVALAGLGLGVWLLGPSVERPAYFAGWAPALGHFETYRGEIRDVRVAGVQVAHGRVRDPSGLARALASGAPITIEAAAVASSGDPAPLFTLHDAEQQEILVVLVRGRDLYYGPRVRAKAAGFDPPTHRWPEALPKSPPGKLHTLEIQPDGPVAHLAVEGERRTSVAWRPGRIWSLVLPDRLVSPRFFAALDALVLALLVLPPFFFSGSPFAQRGLVTALALGALLFALPLLGPVARPGWVEALGLGLGACAALGARALVSRLVAAGHLGCTDRETAQDARDEPPR